MEKQYVASKRVGRLEASLSTLWRTYKLNPHLFTSLLLHLLKGIIIMSRVLFKFRGVVVSTIAVILMLAVSTAAATIITEDFEYADANSVYLKSIDPAGGEGWSSNWGATTGATSGNFSVNTTENLLYYGAVIPSRK